MKRVEWVVLAVALLLSSTAAAQAAPVACPGIPDAVIGAPAQDAADICAGAGAARRFFSDAALAGAPPVTVRVVERLPDGLSPSAVACFVPQRYEVRMLPYAKFRQQRNWFGVKIDRRLYRSVATHEFAHALASCSFANPRPTRQATEYIAYVVMFAMMDAAVRERVLRALPGEPFEDADRISELVLAFDPMQFAVRSYKHFAQPANGVPFVRRVLAGEVLSE